MNTDKPLTKALLESEMAGEIIANDKQATALKLVVDAGFQIEALSTMILAELARLGVFEGEGIKSAIIRIKLLTDVVTSAADEEIHDEYLQQMQFMVHGDVPKGVQHA